MKKAFDSILILYKSEYINVCISNEQHGSLFDFGCQFDLLSVKYSSNIYKTNI